MLTQCMLSAFIAVCFFVAAVLAEYATKAGQVGHLEIHSEYPNALTDAFGSSPKVYIRNVGTYTSLFAYDGQERRLRPSAHLHLPGKHPGDMVEIDLVLSSLLDAHVGGVTRTAPERPGVSSSEEDDGRSMAGEGEVALAVAE